ncbi:MAG: hypothetical protein KF836_09515 [Fimbriimonadaceae bacterium]|nr:hypothetical protein [Fimbriimonadaceae bacterium]
MGRHLAPSLACLLVGIVCLSLVMFDVVAGPSAKLLLAVAAIDFVAAILILVWPERKKE